MSTITFVPATERNARYVAQRLRAADRAELAITSPGKDPMTILVDGVKAARVATCVCIDGKPAIIYGVTPSQNAGVGCIWMLATDAMSKITRYFIQHCAKELDVLGANFAVLTNMVHSKNRRVVRWLQWLGATIDREHPVGELYVFWFGEAQRV